jgi:hypothetical protein
MIQCEFEAFLDDDHFSHAKSTKFRQIEFGFSCWKVTGTPTCTVAPVWVLEYQAVYYIGTTVLMSVLQQVYWYNCTINGRGMVDSRLLHIVPGTRRCSTLHVSFKMRSLEYNH